MNKLLTVTNQLIYEKWIRLTDMCRTQVNVADYVWICQFKSFCQLHELVMNNFVTSLWHNGWSWLVHLYCIIQLRILLQGVSIACYAEPCISYDRVVCPSVTRWHCIKLTQSRITKSSPMDSPRTLVLAIKCWSRNSKGLTPSKGVKWER